ncbi:MAG: winged helix-turn-helix domain-containing protein [Acidobacteriota bacterium]
MNEIPGHVLRFASFELDVEREELRKRGLQINLQAQPLKVLALLASRSGEVISRDEIRRSVWGNDTFVDFEQGINTCIRQIRLVLGDNATTPRFVETVPRKGYRFLAPVDQLAAPPRDAGTDPAAATDPETPAPAAPAPAWRRRVLAAGVAGLATAALVAGAIAVRRDGAPVQTAADARRSAAAPTAEAGMLAVLPFRDYSADQAADYLADGLTEELITELARRYGGRLGVVARTSVMKFKQSDLAIDEIAAELGAQFVLEGSIRQAGERVRVTAQLIRAADQGHLWAGNYDRQMADLLELQSEVSAKIGQALALTLQLSPSEGAAAAATHPEAYDHYLQGRYLFNNLFTSDLRPREAIAAARQLLERATELDPGFAPAQAELARIHRRERPTHDGASRTREAITRALALDDSLAIAHLLHAELRFYYDLDPEAARQSFERALELNPAFAEAHHDFAAYFSVKGRHDEAVASVQRALRLDPLSPGVAADVGWYYYFGGRYDEAIEHSHRTLALEPAYIWAEECLLLSHLAKGDLPGAVAIARDDLRSVGASPADLEILDVDDPAEAIRAYWQFRLERSMRIAERHPVAPTEFATSYIALGENDKALTALERAYDVRAGWILPFLPVHPFFDPLRGEPRFDALLAKIAQAGS